MSTSQAVVGPRVSAPKLAFMAIWLLTQRPLLIKDRGGSVCGKVLGGGHEPLVLAHFKCKMSSGAEWMLFNSPDNLTTHLFLTC